MAISKVIFNGDTLMDVTGDNPATDNMLTGTRATGADGETVNGAVVTAPASTADPAMDGTASPGTASTYSRGDHVHPTDTSRASTSHASSATTYGTGTSSNYGHVKLSDSTSSPSGTSGGVAATPSAVKAVMDAIPSVPTAYTSNPAMDGTASAGSSTSWAKGDHVHPTDTSRAAASDLSDLSDTLATYVRPNLLDNAYFVGGGSQQGGGQFPINQRGQTSYSAVGYTIDRWRLWSTDITVSVTSAGLKLTPASGSPKLYQFLENFEILYGKTVTVSALIGSELVTASGTFSSTAWISGQYTNGYLLFICDNGADASVRVEVSSEVVVKAVKLEIGDTQTLAHQENGVWVLNEIPNFQQELARCQRFYQTYRTQSLRPTYAADCRPVMRTDPSQSSITVSSTTYYVNSADL